MGKPQSVSMGGIIGSMSGDDPGIITDLGAQTSYGGRDGVAFLRKSLDVALFPELIDVRTQLGAD